MRVPRMRHGHGDGRSTTIIGMTDEARESVHTPPPTRPTEPGWYDDGHGDQRWYDGTNWTERVQAPVKEKAPKLASGTVRKSTAAIVGASALVLGLIIGVVASPAPSTDPLYDQIDDAERRAESLEASRDRFQDQAETFQDEYVRQATEIEEREAAITARENAVKVTEETVAANTLPGDGTFIVGKDVQPGTYQSAGGERCYWKRSTLAGDIIDNAYGSGSSVVTVQAGDGLITTAGCADFTKVG